MGRNPARPDLVGRVIRSDEEIRQLRVRPNDALFLRDLDPYLDKPNPSGVGAAYSEWIALEYFGSPMAPFAVFYLDRGRCWLSGAVQWFGASNVEAGRLLGSSTPLPEECRPPYLTNVTFDFDWENGAWAPAPLGGDDAQVGARIQADVTQGGQIMFESAVANYKGRATKAAGGQYSGVPSQGVLILEGISWLVADQS